MTIRRERPIGATASTTPVWAAFWWSLAFGLLSLYWAAGGEVGISTLAQTIQDRTREGDEALRQTTVVTGLLKIGAGVLALATLRPWLTGRWRIILLSILWGVGMLYALYGVAGFFEKLLMALGALDVPDGLGEGQVVWYLLLWEPVWVLGGVLFLLTARRYQRMPSL